MSGQDGVLMGAAMTPPTWAAHDQAVDPTAPMPRADRFYREPPTDAVAGARGILLGLIECYQTPLGDKPFGTHPLGRDTMLHHLRRAFESLDAPTAELCEFPATLLTAEQEIRARAIDYATRLVTEWGFDSIDAGAAGAILIADRFGAYVATGEKPGVDEHVVWAVVAGTWNSDKVMALYGTEEAAEAHVHDRAGEVDDGLSVKACRVLDNPVITRPTTVDQP